MLVSWGTYVPLRVVAGIFGPTWCLMRRVCLTGATVSSCKLSFTFICRWTTVPVLYVAGGTWWSLFTSSALSSCNSIGELSCKLWRDRTLPRLFLSSSITSVVVTGLSVAAGTDTTDTGEIVMDSNFSCS